MEITRRYLYSIKILNCMIPVDIFSGKHSTQRILTWKIGKTSHNFKLQDPVIWVKRRFEVNHTLNETRLPNICSSILSKSTSLKWLNDKRVYKWKRGKNPLKRQFWKCELFYSTFSSTGDKTDYKVRTWTFNISARNY